MRLRWCVKDGLLDFTACCTHYFHCSDCHKRHCCSRTSRESHNRANGTGGSSLTIGPARIGDKFSFTDSQNPQSKISRVFTSGEVEVEAPFTESLSVLAQTTAHPLWAKGGSISETSDPWALCSPKSIEIIGRSSMTYGQISQTIECLWRMFGAERKFRSLELMAGFLGSQTGNGFVRGGKASMDGLMASS